MSVLDIREPVPSHDVIEITRWVKYERYKEVKIGKDRYKKVKEVYFNGVLYPARSVMIEPMKSLATHWMPLPEPPRPA